MNDSQPSPKIENTGTMAADPEWLAQSWRLTAFLQSSLGPAEPSWWATVVGEDPDTVSTNPKQGIRQEQGAYKDGGLLLSMQPGRIDWLYSAELPNLELGLETVPTLGPVAGNLADFRRIAIAWLAMSPPLVRLAVGATLGRAAESKEDAYRLIMEMVRGLRLDSPGCADLLYQINRPRQSKVRPDVAINRLSKWTAAAYQTIQFSLTPSSQSMQPSDLKHSVRLELDINTAPEPSKDLRQDELAPLFDELVALGLEISEKGDIA